MARVQVAAPAQAAKGDFALNSAARSTLTRCELLGGSHSDCIKIGANSGDCTGIMTCDFAVNRSARLEAERRIASLPEETVDCTQCTSPNCVSGAISLCEARSGQCIIVTEILDGGAMNGEGGSPNAGD